MGAWSTAARGAVVLVVAALFVGPAVGGAAGAAGSGAGPCQADGAAHLCLTEANVGATTLSAGSSTDLSVTVENVGEERATAVVVLNVASPANETDSYELRRTSLAPGETVTVTQSVDASTPGAHAMQVVLYNDDLSHRYDDTEPMTVTVEEQALGGPIDTPEYALAALVGSVAVGGGLVFRKR